MNEDFVCPHCDRELGALKRKYDDVCIENVNLTRRIADDALTIHTCEEIIDRVKGEVGTYRALLSDCQKERDAATKRVAEMETMDRAVRLILEEMHVDDAAMREQIAKLTEERDARQALLKRVFGNDCFSCVFKIWGMNCRMTQNTPSFVEGKRADDCPFLPFEKGEGK